MADEVEQMLLALIANGGYEDGDRLPSERDIAEQTGVSRRALRKAFEVLESRGVIWRGVGQGTFVGQRRLRTDDDLLAIGKLTNPEEIMQARLTIEPALASLATRRASSDDLDQIRHAFNKCSSSVTYEAYDRWDEQFHLAISRASKQQLLITLYLTVNRLRSLTSWGSLRKPVMTPERLQRSTEEHRRILEAIEDRNAAQAEDAMIRHLRSIHQVLFQDPRP